MNSAKPVHLPVQRYHAMVFPKHGYWYAECIDLSLAVRRTTRQEAIDALEEQVVLFLQTVAEEGLSPSLAPRPSPLSHRLRYLWYVLQDHVIRSLHASRDDRPRLTFNTPLHA